VLVDQAGILDHRDVSAGEPGRSGQDGELPGDRGIGLARRQRRAHVPVGEREYLAGGVDADRDVDRERPAGQRGALLDVLPEGPRAGGEVVRHSGHRDRPEAAGVGYRRSQLGRAERTQALLHDRVIDADEAGVAVHDRRHDDSLVVPSRHLHNVLHSW
jgi:hypothetical protein